MIPFNGCWFAIDEDNDKALSILYSIFTKNGILYYSLANQCSNICIQKAAFYPFA